MARIEDELLGCVFYLYPSRKAAKAGTPGGGTGFLISMASDVPGCTHVYAVTNKHCINGCKDEVSIRLTGVDGENIFVDRQPDQWECWPRHDLAVLPIPKSEVPAASIDNLDMGMCIPQATLDKYRIGPGDRVFMIGRFMGHDGGEKNVPSVRFGHISMMPGALEHPRGFQGLSWGVEMRSISGYSGSPVFVYKGFGDVDLGADHREFGSAFRSLLGVDWGHIPHKLPVMLGEEKPHPDKSYVKSDSAMCGVVPASDLEWCLNTAKLKEQRAMVERECEERQKAEPIAVLDSSDVALPAIDENPNHRESFTALLNAAARKPPQAD